MSRKFVIVILSVLTCFIMGTATCRADYNWQTQWVSERAYNVINPSLYDGQIAWASRPHPTSGGTDLYFWDGNEVTQLTDTPWIHDSSPSLYNGKIAYNTNPEGIWQNAYWDGSESHQITFGEGFRGLPSLYDGKIAYSNKESETDWDIYYYDCVTEETVRMSDSEWYDFYAVVYDDTIAWIGGITDNRFDVYYWDGSETIMIPSECAMWKPSLYDGQIAWAEVFGYGDDATTDIMFWDGNEKIKLTSSSYNAVHPSLFDGNIAYTVFDGHDYEIMYWDGANFYQVTDDDYVNRHPSLYITDEGEIQIAYVRYTDWDIYEGEIIYLTARGPHGDVPEPSTVLLILTSGGFAALKLLRHRR